MPLALASTVSLSAPLTSAQRPFALWVNGVDLVPYVDKTSYSLDDQDLTQPGILTFDVIDPTNVVGRYINPLDEVVWMDFAASRILYRGYVRLIAATPVATYAVWKITCADVSEMLDYGRPVIADNRPAEKTRDRIQHFLGYYGTLSDMGSGGFINILSDTKLAATAFQKETQRTAIEKSIGLEAGTVNKPSYYLDYNGPYLHVFYGKGDVAAPYNLTDVNPDPGAGTCTYGQLEFTWDSTSDTDGTYVYGSNKTGSGTIFDGPRRYPRRIATVDASESTTAATAIAAGYADIGQRQQQYRVTVVVTGYDGWAKGQYFNLINTPLSVNMRVWIAGVSMKVLSGSGYREYTLTCNTSAIRFSRLAATGRIGGPTLGSGVVGQLGG